MMTVRRAFQCAALAVALAAPAHAALPITPATAQIGYAVFALGLLPMRGTFRDFTGTLTLPPDSKTACAVHVRVPVRSLAMADPMWTARALAPDMLNAAAYPVMQFDGACQGSGVDGMLTLHGTTRPFHLLLARHGRKVTCTGMLMRRDYGINGWIGLLSPRVHISLTMAVPEK